MSSPNPQHDPENVYPEDNTDSVEEPSGNSGEFRDEDELSPYTDEEAKQMQQVDSAVERFQLTGLYS